MTDLDQIVDAVLARHPLAGLSIGVVSRDGLGATAMRGVAGAGRPVDIDTVFRIGSVTKTMTALAVVRLYETGRVGLDDPVNDHLNGLSLVGRPRWRPATIRHLLTHTAGIGELAAWRDVLTRMGGLAVRPGQAVPGVERYHGQLRLDVEPGTKWAYANHGFNVLGLMVEQMTGEPLADHLRSLIFDRLGMQHTDLLRSPRVAGDLATGYTLKRKGLAEPKVVLKHAFRNACIPVITVLGLQFGQLLGGAIITETVFAWPGVATLTVESIRNQDFPVVQCAVILLALLIVGVNLIVDLVVGIMDPRIRAGT